MNEIQVMLADFRANIAAINRLGPAIRDHRADDIRREWPTAPLAARQSLLNAMTWGDRLWLAWTLRKGP